MSKHIDSRKILDILSDSDLNDFFNFLPQGVFIYEFEKPDKLRLIYANETSKKILKINVDELLGKEFDEIWTGINMSDLKVKLINIITKNENILLDDFEFFSNKISGVYKIRILCIGQNKLCVLFDDIKQQKVSKEKLEKIEEKFKLLIENSFDAIYILEGRHYSYVNPQFVNLTGYTIEELTSPEFDFSMLLTEKSKSIIEERYQARLRGEFVPSRYETQIKTKYGEIKDIEITTVSLSEPGNVVVMGIMRDITEKIKQKNELQNAKDTYLGIINSLNEAVYILNKNYQFIFVNKAAEKMYGYKVDDFIGKTPDFLAAKDRNSLEDALNFFKKAFEGEPQQFEFWGLRADGTTFPKSVILSNGYYFGEKVVIATARDITNRKIIEEELIKAKEKAEESDRLKSAFLANMSHEIRTPMNGIIGFANLLSEPNLSEQERFEYSKLLNNSCNRLLKIVNDILDLSKIDSGQMEVKKHIFSVSKVIRDLYESNFLNFQEKGIELKYKIDPTLENYVINSDEQKIYQILSNLINNSLKFTNTGYVEFGCKNKGEYLEFYVEDTGIGISDEYKSKIFQRFSQENPEITRSYEGAGLGLAICKGLVEILGGEINFETEKNKGTKFYFTIPCEKLSENELTPEKLIIQEIKSENTNKVILIAEDDLMNFILIEKLLTRNFENIEILKAKNGEEVLEIVQQRKDISLIIMDIKMPKIDGLEATKILRQKGFSLPIIALTAYAMSGDKEKALEAGCNDYIPKPIDNANLLKILKQYL